MADLITPRLLARVERSLRKRLNSDVSSHLQRYAAQAQSEDEFIAAAARLILSPKDRRQWLDAWVTRRHIEGGDTTPADLPGDAQAPAHHTYRITPAQRERLRVALTREIGPGADALLDDETQRADSAGELLDRLASHLSTDTQRERFRNATMSRSRPGA